MSPNSNDCWRCSSSTRLGSVHGWGHDWSAVTNTYCQEKKKQLLITSCWIPKNIFHFKPFKVHLVAHYKLFKLCLYLYLSESEIFLDLCIYSIPSAVAFAIARLVTVFVKGSTLYQWRQTSRGKKNNVVCAFDFSDNSQTFLDFILFFILFYFFGINRA